MSRDELLLIMNTLRICGPTRQEQVAEWAQAIEIVARELVRAVEEDHANG